MTSSILYRAFEPNDCPQLLKMIYALYQEDPSTQLISTNKIEQTFELFLTVPDSGTILIMQSGEQIAGYAILVSFWSNEYGGRMGIIDELYTQPEFRGKGFASGLIQYIIDSGWGNCVAFRLEVTPQNESAWHLYQKLGFKPSRNRFMDRTLFN